MLLIIRISLVLYGFIALGTGYLGVTASFEPGTSPMEDNNHRFVAAIWASMSLAFFYVAWNPSEAALFRFLMVALFLGGLVRAIALRHYPPTSFILFGIAIELIPTAVLLWMHTRLLHTGSL
ncbi:uncharacterized protein DUF4345 [Neolewinella xylanilytica]|uniref:Uncharacterized protein DUF4345 n=1 Tax=Neolewinella xylanilytica TaxID=1514080 RepID=A0A2S6I850_9BACT|nr:DUF4345 family protein [Neolewinella xylanilytica]PPK87665.1 uncharacterized protein DUF4345 [Neolewinella xylanilytica]